MNRADRAFLTEVSKPALRDDAARQVVCAALGLGIFAIAIRIALIW
jgi:hypothetical protein